MDWKDTAKRLAAHPKWKWLSGMRAVRPGHGPQRIEAHGVEDGCYDAFPDLTDWGTVGVLLGLVVEAAGQPTEKVDFWLPALYAGEFGTWQAMISPSPSGPTKHRVVYPLPGQALGELWLELNP